MPSFERITADDVKVGDKIAKTRTGVFAEVTEIEEAPVSRRFHLWALDNFGLSARRSAAGAFIGNIRPRRTAKLWRLG